MVLRAGYLVVATKLQEAATAMCHEDIRTRLCDALNDAFRGTGNWAYVVAVFGDDKAGDVVYSVNSDLKKAAYAIAGTGAAKIETTTAVDVQPLTTYEVETAQLTEAGARHSKRDVMQLQTIHDAASALGANCSMQESKKPSGSLNENGTLKLKESLAFPVDLELREAFTAGTKIKLISPGKGSSAWYTESALKKAVDDKIFHAGLPMRIDHPTLAEQAARPEGSVKDWGAVLGTDGVWLESYVDKSGKDQGKGIYSDIKTFSDHAQTINEKGAYAGVSIMANGNALVEAGKSVMRDGVPVLKEFTSAEGADMVTRAGAGGMFLQESAAGAANQPKESEMDEALKAELKALREADTVRAAENKRLLERAIRGDARELATTILAPLSLVEASKVRVIADVLSRELPIKDGTLDAAKFTESVNAVATAEGAYVASLLGSGRVRGMGVAAPAIPAEKVKEAKEREAAEFEEEVQTYQRLGLTEAAAKIAAKGRAA